MTAKNESKKPRPSMAASPGRPSLRVGKVGGPTLDVAKTLSTTNPMHQAKNRRKSRRASKRLEVTEYSLLLGSDSHGES